MPVHVNGFVGVVGGRGSNIQAAYGETDEQTVTISGSSVASTNPVGGAATIVRVHATAACHVKIGPTPVATTGSMRMAADQTEYFGVNGGTDKVAVIQGS